MQGDGYFLHQSHKRIAPADETGAEKSGERLEWGSYVMGLGFVQALLENGEQISTTRRHIGTSNMPIWHSLRSIPS